MRRDDSEKREISLRGSRQEQEIHFFSIRAGTLGKIKIIELYLLPLAGLLKQLCTKHKTKTTTNVLETSMATASTYILNRNNCLNRPVSPFILRVVLYYLRDKNL